MGSCMQANQPPIVGIGVALVICSSEKEELLLFFLCANGTVEVLCNSTAFSVQSWMRGRAFKTAFMEEKYSLHTCSLEST